MPLRDLIIMSDFMVRFLGLSLASLIAIQSHQALAIDFKKTLKETVKKKKKKLEEQQKKADEAKKAEEEKEKGKRGTPD